MMHKKRLARLLHGDRPMYSEKCLQSAYTHPNTSALPSPDNRKRMLHTGKSHIMSITRSNAPLVSPVRRH